MCKKYTEKFEMDRRETRWWSRRALSYPLLMSTPKSEPKAEQPSIKKAESTKKKKKKRHSTCKDTKKKPQQNGRRGTSAIQSNPILPGWVTHKQENDIAEVLPQQ